MTEFVNLILKILSLKFIPHHRHPGSNRSCGLIYRSWIQPVPWWIVIKSFSKNNQI